MTGGRDQLTKTLAHIKNHLGRQKAKLAAQYTVKEPGSFGSYVRGEQKPHGDRKVIIFFHRYANCGACQP
jgi:predicted nucleotidyltransferase